MFNFNDLFLLFLWKKAFDYTKEEPKQIKPKKVEDEEMEAPPCVIS